jgi:surface protein|tara:strand:- start:2537 stop:3742 length:1206 start_codon:yes stop_codon:yes gene_type:complete
MAWVAIPNSPDWEYDNAATVADTYTDANGTTASGIRTFTPTGGSVQLTYIKVRRVGDTADTSRGELSKSFWDARGTEDDLQPFNMTVRTTAANEAFTIPCQNYGTFNATIDWGDGSSSTVTTYNDSNLAHTYASAGDHAISISGTFPNIKFGNDSVAAEKVIAVTNLGQVGWQMLERAFKNCDNMTSFTSGVTDTSSVTNMYEIFYACNDMTSCDASGFNTSNVTNMGGMFRYNYDLTSLDISSFDTSSVTNMYGTFWSCQSLTSLDVSNFNTSLVRSMFYMFINCQSLTSLDVSNFDTSSVTNMNGMFFGGSSLTDIVGIENFNIEGIDNTIWLSNFMNSVTLPTARYDALLVNWDAQDPLDNLVPNFGSSQYTAGGAAEAARANLISTDGWTITDGGAA